MAGSITLTQRTSVVNGPWCHGYKLGEQVDAGESWWASSREVFVQDVSRIQRIGDEYTQRDGSLVANIYIEGIGKIPSVVVYIPPKGILFKTKPYNLKALLGLPFIRLQACERRTSVNANAVVSCTPGMGTVSCHMPGTDLHFSDRKVWICGEPENVGRGVNEAKRPLPTGEEPAAPYPHR